MTAVVAALSDQQELVEFRGNDRPPRMELEELKAALGDEEVANEIAYLRDAGVVSTEGYTDGTLDVVLNPDIRQEAGEVKERMYEHHDGFPRRVAASDNEYLDFEAPSDDGWPDWDEPEQNELARGSIEYNRGGLCAVLSIYGDKRAKGANLPQHTVESAEDTIDQEGYELEIDVEKQLERLERIGYLERYSAENGEDRYRLADDREVKRDAEKIKEFRDEIFSGIPRNMAVAYQEADRRELENKGVKLVKRPETKAQ